MILIGWSYRSLDDILMETKTYFTKLITYYLLQLSSGVRSVGDYTFCLARAVLCGLVCDDMKLTAIAQAGIGPMKILNCCPAIWCSK